MCIRDRNEDADAVEFEIISFSDPSGNELISPETHTADDNMKSVRVDTTAPQVSTVTFASSNTSSDPDYSDALLAKVDDTVTLSFTTDERVEGVEVKINGTGYSATDMGSGTSWQAEHTVSSGESADAVAIRTQVTSYTSVVRTMQTGSLVSGKRKKRRW